MSRPHELPHAFEPIRFWVAGEPDPSFTDWCAYSPELKAMVATGMGRPEEAGICTQQEFHRVHWVCVHCEQQTTREDPGPFLCAMCEAKVRVLP